MMKRAVLLATMIGAAACQTTGGHQRSTNANTLTAEEIADQSRRQTAFDKACKTAVGPVDHESPGDMVVVRRDESSKSRTGAIGVTAGGGLKEAAGFVGTGIVTSRGGATIVEDGSPDVEMQTCVDPEYDERDY